MNEEQLTLSELLKYGTPRKRKDGSESIQVYTLQFYSSPFEKMACLFKKGVIRGILEKTTNFHISVKQSNALSESVCRNCEYILKENRSGRIIFGVKARYHHSIQYGRPVRKKIPINGSPPSFTFCGKLVVDPGNEGRVTTELIDESIAIPIKKELCIHGASSKKK